MNFLRCSFAFALAFACFALFAPRALAADSASATAAASTFDDGSVTFTAQPTGPASALVVGDSLNLAGAVITSPAPVTYQWFLNGAAIPGATSDTYAKAQVSLADAGLYRLVATNSAGPVSSALVQVVVAPRPGAVVPGQATTGRPSFANGSVLTLVALPDGGALVGGLFTAQPALNLPQNHLVHVRPDGSTDTSFNLTVNGSVRALLVQPDGKILVAGSFTAVAGASQRTLFRLNADLTLDTAFNSAVASAITSAWGTPTDLALDSAGRVYLGLNPGFTTSSVRRFSSTGVLDAGYGLTISLTPFGVAGVSSLAVQPDDHLLVGGNFSQITPLGQAAVAKNRLARVAPDGSIDAGFTALDNLPVNDLLVTPSGRVFVSRSGSSTLAELSPTTGATLTNGPPGGLTAINKIVLGPDGRLALSRTVASGPARLARLDIPAGSAPSVDTTFAIGTGPDGAVAALAYAPDGTLWIAGGFTTFDGFASGGIVNLEGTASDPEIVNNPLPRADLDAGATASLFVGAVGTDLAYEWFKNGIPLVDDARISGATTAVLSISGLIPSDDDTYTVEVTGGTPATTLTSAPAKLNVLGAPKVLASPTSVSPALGSTVTLAADVLAASPATYVWKRGDTLIVNGGRYSGATTATLVIADVNATDNGAYTLTVTNALGTATTTPASMTVEENYTARAAGTTAIGGGGHGLRDILHLPDGRTLLAAAPVMGGLFVVNPDHTVSALPGGVFEGSVEKLLRQPDGKILAAGTFSPDFGFGRPFLARLNADLSLDTTFVPTVHLNQGVFDHLALDGEGRVYAAGSFTDYAGHASLDRVVRFEGATGALDLSFAPADFGINGSVHALASDSSGRVLIAMGFSTANYDPPTHPFSPLVRFSASGQPDTSFQSEVVDANLVEYAIDALAVDALGRILRSTRFVGDSGQGISVDRLLPSGARDASFGFADSLLDQAPTALLPLPTGKLLVGGPFTTPSPGHLLRLEPDGTVDSGFSIGSGFYGHYISTLAVDARGRLWAGGLFSQYQSTSADGIVVLQGETPAFAITRQPRDYSRDLGSTATFSVAVAANNGPSYQWRKNGAPLDDDGRISGATTGLLTIADLAADDAAAYSVHVSIPGGELVSAPATLTVLAGPVVTRSPAHATIDLGGSATFVGAATGASTLSYQWLFEDAPLDDGIFNGVTIAGATTPALTITRAGFAQAGAYRLRVSNALDTATSELARLTVVNQPGKPAAGIPALSFDYEVCAILRLADDSILVGGQFTSVTGKDFFLHRGRLARFLPDGSIDPYFAPHFNGAVRALAQDSAGRVLIAGDFTIVTVGDTTTARTRVARLTPELALDPAFDTSATGPNAPITALAPTGDGGVYVGGGTAFSAVGTTAVNSLARLDASGALDTGFIAPASYGSVAALLLRPDGKLYAGGSFGAWLLEAEGTRDMTFNPALFQAFAFQMLIDGRLLVGAPDGYLRPLDADTGATTPADFSTGHSYGVTALAQQDDGKILSASFRVLKRTHPVTGADDSGFLAFNSNINAITVDASGQIWVGGFFTEYGGAPANRIAVLAGGDYATRNGLLAPQTITFPAILDRLFGATPAANTVTLAATSSAGLAPITFSVTSSTPAGIATISGDTLTISGAGTITVEAAQGGGSTGGILYAPAEPVSRTFEVVSGPPTQTQTITFDQPAALTYGDDPLELEATASSGLPVVFQLVSTAPAGIATLDGHTLAILGAGKVTMRATQPGAPQPFKPAPPVTRTITINKADLGVSFDSASRFVSQRNPAFPPLYSGFVHGDTEADLARTRPVGKTTATIASHPGQYPITFTGGLDANYRFVAGAPAYLTVKGFGGDYEALLLNEAGTPVGKLELRVPGNTLTYTGTLNLASEPAALSIRGDLDASDDIASSTWTRSGTATASDLSLGIVLAEDALDGFLTRNNEATFPISSGSRLFVQTRAGNTKLPCPWTGAHTLILREPLALDEVDARSLPLGASHASAAIAATGTMSLKGKLADGAILTATAKPDATGRFRVFARPYSQRLDSFLAGELPLEAHPNQARFENRFHVGEGKTHLAWAKAALPQNTLPKNQDKSCRSGFSARVHALLDPWLPPSTHPVTVNGVSIPAGTLAQRLDLADDASSSASVPVAFILPEGADLGARGDLFPTALTLSAKGAFSVPLPLPAAADNPAFTLKVTPATGAFTGSFLLRDQVAPTPVKPVDRKVTVSGTLRQGPATGVTDTLGHAHFLFDPIPGDAGANAAEQISGELILSAPVSSD